LPTQPKRNGNTKRECLYQGKGGTDEPAGSQGSGERKTQNGSRFRDGGGLMKSCRNAEEKEKAGRRKFAFKRARIKAKVKDSAWRRKEGKVGKRRVL